MNYRIIWEIDIEADNAREAAQLARTYQLNPDSTATIFLLIDDNGKSETIDLLDNDNDETH